MRIKLRVDYNEREKIAYTRDFDIVDECAAEVYENRDGEYIIEPVQLDVEERNDILTTHAAYKVTDAALDTVQYLLIPDVTSYNVKSYNSNIDIVLHRVDEPNEHPRRIEWMKEELSDLTEEEQDEIITAELYEIARPTEQQYNDIMRSIGIWLER